MNDTPKRAGFLRPKHPVVASMTPEQWQHVRNYWSSGAASMRETADKFGIPFSTLQKRASREQWTLDPANPIEHATVRKVVQKEAKRVRDRGQGGGQGQGQSEATTPLPEIPQTIEQITESEAEIRADKIMEHRQEWRDFEERIRAETLRIFAEPPTQTRRARSEDGQTVEVLVPDFSKIDAAKKIAETLAIKQKSERSAYNLDHNLNLSKKAEEAERRAAIKDTFKALQEMVQEAAERERAIDITPAKRFDG